MFIWLVAILVGLFGWFYIQTKHKYTYWSRQNIPGPKPLFPFGNLHSRALISPDKLEIDWMRRYGKVYGIFNGSSPTLVVIDPELVKQVTISDFNPHFVNRIKFPVYHWAFNQAMNFALDGKWKRIRTISTPSFSSGKLRAMNILMSSCVEKLVKYLDQAIETQGGVIQTKEVIVNFTTNVIASTAFATDTDANDNRAKSNPVVVHGRKLFDVNPFKRLFVLSSPKWILDLFGIEHFLQSDSFEFFIQLAKHIISERKKGLKRNDLVQLLIDATADEASIQSEKYDNLEANDGPHDQTNKSESSNPKKLTESEIIAQCIIIFSAGLETTAATISHFIFEMAHNPDLQEKLYQILNTTLNGLDETSEEYFDKVMNGIPFLEASVKETLRKYPAATRLSRLVGTDGYQLNGISLPKGMAVEIPVTAIHHCPDYYPNSDCFDPYRFMPENREKLIPYTYLPFGLGPRNCIGMRFALQEIKLCLAKIMRRFQFELTSDTPNKLTYKPNIILLCNEFPTRVCLRK